MLNFKVIASDDQLLSELYKRFSEGKPVSEIYSNNYPMTGNNVTVYNPRSLK